MKIKLKCYRSRFGNVLNFILVVIIMLKIYLEFYFRGFLNNRYM